MQNSKRLNEIKSIVKNYKKSLEKDGFSIEEIFLYGSYAKGTQKTYSDIDVCVVSDKFYNYKDKQETLLWQKALEIDPRIEPVGYYPTSFKEPDPLVYEVKKYGIKI
ncbi:nucleotidyltransferase domain-containing protein [Candidatus Azambacteria bacterium]|nr:nucleotidyltransferase domain-containing protein [Candidatus Azambacteria bacterium]